MGAGGPAGPQIELEPHGRDAIARHAPAVRDLADQVQTPPGVVRRLDGPRLEEEPAAGVAHLHTQRLADDPGPESDRLTGREISVPDAVGHQLAHQQPCIVQDRRRDLAAQIIQRAPRDRDGVGFGQQEDLDRRHRSPSTSAGSSTNSRRSSRAAIRKTRWTGSGPRTMIARPPRS